MTISNSRRLRVATARLVQLVILFSVAFAWSTTCHAAAIGAGSLYSPAWLLGSPTVQHAHFFSSGPVNVRPVPRPGPDCNITSEEAAALQLAVGIHCVDPLSGLLYAGTNPVVVFSLDYSSADQAVEDALAAGSAVRTTTSEAAESRMRLRHTATLDGWATNCIVKNRNELYIQTITLKDGSGEATAANDTAVIRTPRWGVTYSVFNRISGTFMRSEPIAAFAKPGAAPLTAPLLPRDETDTAAQNEPSSSSSSSSSSSAASSSDEDSGPGDGPRQALRGLSLYSGHLAIIPYTSGHLAFEALYGTAGHAWATVSQPRIVEAATGTILTSPAGAALTSETRLFILGTDPECSEVSPRTAGAAEAVLPWDVAVYRVPPMSELFPGGRPRDNGTLGRLTREFSFYEAYGMAMGLACNDCAPCAFLPVVVRRHGDHGDPSASVTDGVMMLRNSHRLGNITMVDYMARLAPPADPDGTPLGLHYEQHPVLTDQYRNCAASAPMTQDSVSGDVYASLVCSLRNAPVPTRAAVVLRIVRVVPTAATGPSASLWSPEAAPFTVGLGDDNGEGTVSTPDFTAVTGATARAVTRTLDLLLPQPSGALSVMGIPLTAILSTAPRFVDAAGGTALTITGHGFTPNMLCRFPGAAGAVVRAEYRSPSAIVCRVPPMTHVSCDVRTVDVKVSLATAASLGAFLSAAVALPPSFVAGSATNGFLRLPTPKVLRAREEESLAPYVFAGSSFCALVDGDGFAPVGYGANMNCKLWSPAAPVAAYTAQTVVRESISQLRCCFPLGTRPLPRPSYMDVTNDGHIYSNSSVGFLVMGVPVALEVRPAQWAEPEAFAGADLDNTAPTVTFNVTVAAGQVVRLPPMTVVLTDAQGHAVFYNSGRMASGYAVSVRVQSLPTTTLPPVPTDGAAAHGWDRTGDLYDDELTRLNLSSNLTVPMDIKGTALFKDLVLNCPATGNVTLVFLLTALDESYVPFAQDMSGDQEAALFSATSASAQIPLDTWEIVKAATGAQVTLDVSVTEGAPYQLKFVRQPSTTVTATSPVLSDQPIVGLADICGNVFANIDSRALPGPVTVSVENEDPVTGSPYLVRWTVTPVNNLFYVTNASVIGKHSRSYSLHFTTANAAIPALTSLPVRVEWCRAGQLAVLSLGTCAACPAHGICDGTGKVVAADGYWRYAAEVAAANASETLGISWDFHSCLPPHGYGACGPDGVCATGYRGFGCLDCAVGYNRAGKRCTKCRGAAAERFVVFLVCLVLIGLFGVWVLWMAYTPNTVSPLVWALKQLINIFQYFSLFALVKTEWPAPLVRFFDGIFATAHAVDVLVTCGVTPRGAQVFLFVLPVALSVITGFIARLVISIARPDRIDPITMSALAVVSYTHRKKHEFLALRQEVAGYAAGLAQAAEADRAASEDAERERERESHHHQRAGRRGRGSGGAPADDAIGGLEGAVPAPLASMPESIDAYLSDRLGRLAHLSGGGGISRCTPEKDLLRHFESAAGIRYSARVGPSPFVPTDRAARSAAAAPSPWDEHTDGDMTRAPSDGLCHSGMRRDLTDTFSEDGPTDFIGTIEAFGAAYQRAVGGMILNLPTSNEVQEWIASSDLRRTTQGAFNFRDSSPAAVNGGGKDGDEWAGTGWYMTNGVPSIFKDNNSRKRSVAGEWGEGPVEFEESPVLNGLRQMAVRQFRFSNASLISNTFAAVIVVLDFVFISNSLLWQRCDRVRTHDPITVAGANPAITFAVEQSYSRASSSLLCDSPEFTSIRNLGRASLVVYGCLSPACIGFASLYLRHAFGTDVMYATLPVVHFGLPQLGVLGEVVVLCAKYVACIAVVLCDSPMVQVGVLTIVLGLVSGFYSWCYPQVLFEACKRALGITKDATTTTAASSGSSPSAPTATSAAAPSRSGGSGDTASPSVSQRAASPLSRSGAAAPDAAAMNGARTGGDPDATQLQQQPPPQMVIFARYLIFGNPRRIMLISSLGAFILSNVLLLYVFIQSHTNNGMSLPVRSFFSAFTFIAFGVIVIFLTGACVMDLVYWLATRTNAKAAKAAQDAARLAQLRAMCASYRQLCTAFAAYFQLCQSGVMVSQALDILARRIYDHEKDEFFDFSAATSERCSSREEEEDVSTHHSSRRGSTATASDIEGSRGYRRGRPDTSTQAASSFHTRSSAQRSANASFTTDRLSNAIANSERSNKNAHAQPMEPHSTGAGYSDVDGTSSYYGGDLLAGSGSGSTASPRQQRRHPQEQSPMGGIGVFLDPASYEEEDGPVAHTLSQGMRGGDGSFTIPDMVHLTDNPNWVQDPEVELRRRRRTSAPAALSTGQLADGAVPAADGAQDFTMTTTATATGTVSSNAAALGGGVFGSDQGSGTPGAGGSDPTPRESTGAGPDRSPSSAAAVPPKRGSPDAPDVAAPVVAAARTLRLPAFAKVRAPARQPEPRRASSLVLSARNSPEEELPLGHPLRSLTDLVARADAQALSPMPEITLEKLVGIAKSASASAGTTGPSSGGVAAAAASNTSVLAQSAAAELAHMLDLLPSFDVATDFDPLAVAPLPPPAVKPAGGATFLAGGTDDASPGGMMRAMEAFNRALTDELFSPTVTTGTAHAVSSPGRPASVVDQARDSLLCRVVLDAKAAHVSTLDMPEVQSLLERVGLGGAAGLGFDAESLGLGDASRRRPTQSGTGDDSLPAGTRLPPPLPPPLPTYKALSTVVSKADTTAPTRRSRHVFGMDRPHAVKGGGGGRASSKKPARRLQFGRQPYASPVRSASPRPSERRPSKPEVETSNANKGANKS